MFSKISNGLTDLIADTLTDINADKREVIEYGIYMSVSEAVKIGLILIAAAFLGIIPYVFGVIAIYGVQRMLLGGLHAKTHLGCIITHSAIISAVITASMLSKLNTLYILPFIALFSYITAYRYAPADMPQKPVVSRKQRRYLRAGGFILLSVLFAVSLIVPRIWSSIILFTCFIQALLMTPLAYRITKNKYGREEVTT